MQPGLAAVLARPVRLRAEQADAGARRVEVHLPVGGVEDGHVVLGEELRSGVRALERGERPGVRERGALLRRHDRHGVRDARRPQPEHVARGERAPRVPTDRAEVESTINSFKEMISYAPPPSTLAGIPPHTMR